MKTYQGEPDGCLLAALSTVIQEDCTHFNYTHIEQVRDLLQTKGKDFTILERHPDCFTKAYAEERFKHYLFNNPAILLIEEPRPHAIAWTLQGLYDGHERLEEIPEGVRHALIII